MMKYTIIEAYQFIIRCPNCNEPIDRTDFDAFWKEHEIHVGKIIQCPSCHERSKTPYWFYDIQQDSGISDGSAVMISGKKET